MIAPMGGINSDDAKLAISEKDPGSSVLEHIDNFHENTHNDFDDVFWKSQW